VNIPIAPNNTSAYETTRSVAPQATATLASMELNTFVCSSGDTYSQTLHWTSADTGIATVNSSTGAVTGISYGVATITGTKIISGTTYSVSYKMVVSALPVSGYEIEYDDSIWNTTTIQGKTNCYAYALNNHFDPISLNDWNEESYYQAQQPGMFYNLYKESEEELLDLSLNSFDEDACANAAAKDNEMYNRLFGTSLIFRSIGADEVCSPGCYKVLLMIDNTTSFFNGTDYHWFRQDADGFWSHKQGDTEVKRFTDANGDLVGDPRTVTVGEYTVFGGFFEVTPWNHMYNVS